MRRFGVEAILSWPTTEIPLCMHLDYYLAMRLARSDNHLEISTLGEFLLEKLIDLPPGAAPIV